MSSAEDKLVENFVRCKHSRILYRDNKEKWICLPNIYSMKKDEEWMQLCPCLTKIILEMIVNNCNRGQYVFSNKQDFCKINNKEVYIKPLDSRSNSIEKLLLKSNNRFLSKIIEYFLLVYVCRKGVGAKEFYAIRNLCDEEFLLEQLELETSGELEEYQSEVIKDIKHILELCEKDFIEDNIIQVLQIGNAKISENYTYKLLKEILEKCRIILNGDVAGIYQRVGDTLFSALSYIECVSA